MFFVNYMNFTQCAINFMADNSSDKSGYLWQGTPVDTDPNDTYISYRACRELCGGGIQWYEWDVISSAVLTWVLPIGSVLLQAPFESNQARRTFFTLCRWIGSPIASLACIFWNISVSAKCARLVDRSVYRDFRLRKEKEEPCPEETIWLSIRDSFTILVNMNMFTIDTPVDPEIDYFAQGLLRLALFSRDLPIDKSIVRRASVFQDDGLQENLTDARKFLAQKLRMRRRRGIVPVFISTAAFVFALAISVGDAFSKIGQNTTAHDLALGLLLCFIPVIVMGSIVDRNPVAPDDICESLNKFIKKVVLALKDDAAFNQYLESIDPNVTGHTSHIKMRKKAIALRNFLTEEHRKEVQDMTEHFFGRFAGQSRKRWHFGAAHSILLDFEKSESYRQTGEKNWLIEDEPRARHSLVLGRRDHGLRYYDQRQIVQLISATFIVIGTTMGGWVLSYYTPTVGLGCRSGSHSIFLTIAFTLASAEFVCWQFPAITNAKNSPRVHSWAEWIFRTLEIINTVWLVFLCTAQSIGVFENCLCWSSYWSPNAGYIDLQVWTLAPAEIVRNPWIAGTVISCTFWGLALIYIVFQWWIQSHISSEDINKAKRSLQRVRKFRRILNVFRSIGGCFLCIMVPKSEKGETIGWYPNDSETELMDFGNTTHDVESAPRGLWVQIPDIRFTNDDYQRLGLTDAADIQPAGTHRPTRSEDFAYPPEDRSLRANSSISGTTMRLSSDDRGHAS